MTSTSQKVDTELRRLARKDARTLVVFALVVCGLIWFLTPNIGSTSKVRGHVVNFGVKPTVLGERPFAVVQIESGSTVRASGVGQGEIKAGDSVVVQITNPLTIGWPTYRIVKRDGNDT